MAISTWLASEAVGCGRIACLAITTGANAGRTSTALLVDPLRFGRAGLVWSPSAALLSAATRAFRRQLYARHEAASVFAAGAGPAVR